MCNSLLLRRAAPRRTAGVVSFSLFGVLIGAAGAQQAHDEVVVTGVPHRHTPGELAQSVTVLRGDALNRDRAANLGETLATQLGVSSSYFGAGASRPIIRGLAGARVRTLEDGIDSMDAAGVSDDHAVAVDPLVADQIEIFRGPTTLFYGSGAVGGVINTVTARIPEVAPNGMSGGFEVRGDTVSNGREAAVRLDGGSGRLAWHFDAAGRDSDDYDIPGFAQREHEQHADEAADEEGAHERGVLENSAIETRSAAAGASWLGERGFLGASLRVFDTNYGVPGHEHEAGEDVEEHGEVPVRIDLTQRRLDLKGGWTGLTGAIEGVNVRIGVSDYEHLELEGGKVGTRFLNDAAEARVELVHAPVGRWTGAFGVQIGERDFEALGEEAFVPPVKTASYGVFLVEQLDLDPWQLSFGGRIETAEQRPSGDAPDVRGRAASLSAAGIRELGSGLSLALNLARAERLPVAEELYSNGPHLATGAVQIGDAALTPETSSHVDVGLRGEHGDITWSVTLFATRYDDFIFLEHTGAVDPEHELAIFAFTQRDAKLDGIETELFTPLATLGNGGELDLRVYADYVRGRLADGGDLPRMPPLRYGARLQYHNERFLAGLETTRYDAQDRVAAFETATAGYTMVNADLRWRKDTASGLSLELFVNGSNLTDEEARKHTSFVKELAPLPGRNYSVGVRSRF